jgi:hypothetical protein
LFNWFFADLLPSKAVMQLARPRPPLLATGLTLALLLLGPSWLLWRTPRPHALGLERLAASASLLQSFRSGSSQPPLALWTQRLGPGLAQQLWGRQLGLWWQFWGGHGDGAEFLVLPGEPFDGAQPLPLPPLALRVDDVVVIAADPLNRQWLQDQLRLKFAPPKGLQRQCLNALKVSESVYWSGPTLGQMLGPLTPLFLPFQQGCFSFAAQGKSLIWQGQAASLGATLVGSQRGASPAQPPPRVPAGLLLQLQGGRLAPLVDGLLASRLVRDPLQKRYGLGPAQLGLLRQAPFQMRIRSQAKGPYQASLALQLGLTPGNRPDWQLVLKGLRKGLLAQGLLEREAASPRWQRQGTGDAWSASTWQGADGTVVGGWRWLIPRPPAATGPSSQGQPLGLLLFLGPEPSPGALRSAALDANRPGADRPDQLSLWAQPQALDRLGLWPTGAPPLIKRSKSLQIQARALQAGGWSAGSGPSQVVGQLELP